MGLKSVSEDPLSGAAPTSGAWWASTRVRFTSELNWRSPIEWIILFRYWRVFARRIQNGEGNCTCEDTKRSWELCSTSHRNDIVRTVSLRIFLSSSPHNSLDTMVSRMCTAGNVRD